MNSLNLYRIDLSTDSRNILAALIKLLGPHAPYSLQILGTVLNTGPRSSTLQDVDPSKVSLWSTVPLHFDPVPTNDHPALFSIITFSYQNRQFRFFCSGESQAPSDPPTEAEKAHVAQVFEGLRDMAHEARPTYDSAIVALGGESWPRHRVDTDPSMIVIGGIHEKWADVLAPMTTFQNPNVRYVFPRGAFSHDAAPVNGRMLRLEGGLTDELVSSEIRASDLSFVLGASTVPRSDGYILSRAPYSACLRSRAGEQPVACALMHADGSIGVVHVDPNYQRQGLGGLVLRALTEKLDFGNDREGTELLPGDHYQDLGGGALGWNWVNVAVDNESGSRFFSSLAGKEGRWTCHWTYMLVDPN